MQNVDEHALPDPRFAAARILVMDDEAPNVIVLQRLLARSSGSCHDVSDPWCSPRDTGKLIGSDATTAR